MTTAPPWAAEVPAALADARAAMVQPEHISDIMFTSGTTGRSKGAMSTHRQSLAVARAWAECGRLTSADRYLMVNPFFHSFGFKTGILACDLHRWPLPRSTTSPQYDVAERGDDASWAMWRRCLWGKSPP